MTSLADILKAKKEAAKPAEDVLEIDYISKGHAAVGEVEFLSCYTILICNPYETAITDFRTFRTFFLDDRQYTLNTFTRLDTNKLLRLYMIHHPIGEPKQLQSLYLTLWELELCVPGLYQDGIERLILASSKRKNFLIDKLPDFG